MLVVGREERSSVGGATLDSGSWRFFFNFNSLRGTKSVLIFSKLVSVRSSSSGIVFASKLSVATPAITLNLSLLFYTTKTLKVYSSRGPKKDRLGLNIVLSAPRFVED